MFLLLTGQLFSPVTGQIGAGQCYAVACVDLDKDGAFDILTASSDGVRYYRNLNNGRVSFSYKGLIFSEHSKAVLAGDFNNDGFIDIFVPCTGRDFILRNQGNNSDFTTLDFPESANSASASLVDFDRDGDLDICVLTSLGAHLYRNYVDSFSLADSFPNAYAVSWADYTGDGWEDLALAVSSEIIFYKCWHTANVVDSFSKDVTIAARNPRGLCWADFDNDGHLDLAVADSLGPNIIVKPTLNWDVDTVEAAILPSVSVAAGDFYAEQGADILFVNSNGANHIYKRLSSGSFATTPDTLSSGSAIARSVAIADLDNSNGCDLILVGSGGNIIYKSETSRANRIILTLHGRGDRLASLSNTIAAGANLTLYRQGSNDILGFCQLSAGSGRYGQDAPQVSFPVTGTTENYNLVIRWPRSLVRDQVSVSALPFTLDAFEDMTPPSLPSPVSSPSHSLTNWSSNRQVRLIWKRSVDLFGSGLEGYSTLWTLDTNQTPDKHVNLAAPDTDAVLTATCEGDSCYFIITAIDSVHNQSASARYGPMKLDFTPPQGVASVQPSSNKHLNYRRLSYTWNKGSDTLSGLKQYSLQVSRDSFFIGPLLEDESLNYPDTTFLSAKLIDEGNYYWRVVATDSAGNNFNTPPSGFTIDTTAPFIQDYWPKGSNPPLPTNTDIAVVFNERMDTIVTANAVHYALVALPARTPIPFDVYVSKVGDRIDPKKFILDPSNDLAGNTEYEVTVFAYPTAAPQDLAGNRMAPDNSITWTFRTDLAADNTAPWIKFVDIKPNPTGGASKVRVEALVDDSATVSSAPSICYFKIDNYDSLHYMDIKTGIPDSVVEIFEYEFDINSLGLSDGVHLLKFKARDESKNWSDEFTDTLYISRDTKPPAITVSNLHDSLYVGDILEGRVRSSEPLASLRLAFSQLTYTDTFYDTVAVALAADSSSIQYFIPLKGFPSGLITAKAIGTDRAGNDGSDEFEFHLSAKNLLVDSLVFVAPNPVINNTLNVFFTPGDRVTAHLYVYTIDGQPVWTPEPMKNVLGGRRSSFSRDVSTWPSGLYFFKLELVHKSGKKARVKKAFAIVR